MKTFTNIFKWAFAILSAITIMLSLCYSGDEISDFFVIFAIGIVLALVSLFFNYIYTTIVNKEKVVFKKATEEKKLEFDRGYEAAMIEFKRKQAEEAKELLKWQKSEFHFTPTK